MKKFILTLSLLFSTYGHATTQYVFNASKNEVIVDQDSEKVRPIASITKLMTAIIVLDSGDSLSEKLSYRGFLGKKSLSREQLLNLLLVKSDNQAAEILARNHKNGRDVFISLMNHKASQLGMLNTTYEDASGLGINNQSTGKDLSLLLLHAYTYDKIRDIASNETYSFTEKSKKRKKVVVVHNTNFNLLHEFKEIIISKTGYTNPAGKCLAMVLTKNNEKYTIVILGEKNTREVQRVGKSIIDKL